MSTFPVCSLVVPVLALSLASVACAGRASGGAASPPSTSPATRAPEAPPAIAPAGDAAVLADGRRVAAAFFSHETHAIWERFTPPLQARIGSEEGFEAFRAGAGKQLGAESSIVSERVERAAGVDLYVRIAKYERVGSAIKMAVGFDADRKIAAFLIAPDKHAEPAPTTKSDYRTQATLRLPFDGAWDVAWGGRTLEQNQHIAVADQRFAYDFYVVEGGATHRGDGRHNEDYFAYGRPVLAPAAGRVVIAVDGLPDNVPGAMDAVHVAGNHVIIDHGRGEFSLLAHLAPGSVLVKVGDPVRAGQELGRCGNTGHSSEPHLHYHLQNGAQFGAAEGLPAQFVNYVADGAPVARGEPTRKQRIEHAPASSARRD